MNFRTRAAAAVAAAALTVAGVTACTARPANGKITDVECEVEVQGKGGKRFEVELPADQCRFYRVGDQYKGRP